MNDNRYSADAEFNRLSISGEAPASRGFIRCEVTPIAGGCRLTVKSAHQRDNDQITLVLLAEVLDRKKVQLRTITLATLAKDAAPAKPSYRREMNFELDYAEIDAYLQAFNPALKLNPGVTQLAVYALYPGHSAGGFSRGGAFRLPPALDASTGKQPLAQSAPEVAARGGVSETELPLDMQVAFPDALTQEHQQFKPGGSIRTRLESEFKGSSSAEALRSAVRTAYSLAAPARDGTPGAVERVLGEDWSIEPVRRYWIKDDGSPGQPGRAGRGLFEGYRVDAQGLPLQDPLVDRYFDTGDLAFTRAGGALRLRANRQAVCLNVKPGAGRRDQDTGVVQRIEVGLDLQPGTTSIEAASALKRLSESYRWTNTIFNHADRQVRAFDPALNLSAALEPWVEVVQNRHKFELKHRPTGVGVELSLDQVSFETLRPQHRLGGKPRRGAFAVVEAELDHLQLQSANEASYPAGASQSVSSFSSPEAERDWLSKTSPDVTLDIEPRLHELADLDNATFRASSAYRSFTSVSKRLIPALFPEGLSPVGQKAARAAELVGLVNADLRGTKTEVARLATEAGIKWTSELEKAVETLLADPKRLAAFDREMAERGAGRILGLLRTHIIRYNHQISRDADPHVASPISQQFGGTYLLEYDPAQLRRRVASRLEELGYALTPGIEALLTRISAATLPPEMFESELEQMAAIREDDRLFSGLAQKLQIAPSPAPAPNVEALFAPGRVKTYRAGLGALGVDAALLDELKPFCLEAAAAGASVFRIRQMLTDLCEPRTELPKRLEDLEAALELLASDHHLTDRAPRPHFTKTAVRARASAVLAQHFMRLGPGLDELLDGVATERTAVEALRWLGFLGREPQLALQRASRPGVRPPKPDYIIDSFDKALDQALAKATVVVDAGFWDFMHTCLDRGVSSSALRSVAQSLASVDLRSALTNARIHLGDLEVPELSFDTTKVIDGLRQNSAFAVDLVRQEDLEDFVEQGLARGMLPQHLSSHLATAYYNGRSSAARSANEEGFIPPPFSFDPDLLRTQIAKRASHLAWTPEIDAYAKEALKVAVGIPSFAPSRVIGPELASVLAELEKTTELSRFQASAPNQRA